MRKYCVFINYNYAIFTYLQRFLHYPIFIMESSQLKKLRKHNNLTQKECAEYLGIPLRTYQNYENDLSKQDSIKYKYIYEKLKQLDFIDENHGILKLQQIIDICGDIFEKYSVQFCYLFGSYAKGKANEQSDVDLLISTTISGITFYELVETLREDLRKKVDLLSVEQLKDNLDLTKEILKDGIKIYG